MLKFLAIVLGIATVVVYYQGVRPGKEGAVKLMAALAGLTIIFSLWSMTGRYEDPEIEEMLEYRYHELALLGRALRSELSRHDNILFLTHPADPTEIEAMNEEMGNAFQGGAPQKSQFNLS